MRIYRKVIPKIAGDIIERLTRDKDIELGPGLREEAEEDFAAIMRSYMDVDDQVTELAKDALERRGMGLNRLMKIKEVIAKDKGHKVGDEGIDYVINQMLEFTLISRNIDEVYSPDHVMRRKIFQIMKRHLDVDEELDRMARARLRNVDEGTSAWDVEYNKEMERLRRLKGLE